MNLVSEATTMENQEKLQKENGATPILELRSVSKRFVKPLDENLIMSNAPLLREL